MPRGKELKQLPMSNISPAAGPDKGKWDRNSLSEAPALENPTQHNNKTKN
jgi:hypothetical protein